MKISLSNLEKIMERCTKKEIDLIIYIGQFQDDYGIIKGIDYKDVLDNIFICKSTFYKLLYSLEEKEIIKVNYFSGDYGYWEVEIINNVFAKQEDFKKGYLKLNFDILHSLGFKEMTKSEKLIVIHLLRINDFRKEKIKITLKKMMEWTGKSLRSVRKFIDTLSNFLKIIKKDNLLLIDCLFGFDCRQTSEADIRLKHIIDYRLKKAKCQSAIAAVYDAITVFKQYKLKSDEAIIKILDDTITNFGTLMPKYINKMTSLIAQ